MNRFALLLPVLLFPVLFGCSGDDPPLPAAMATPSATGTSTPSATPASATPTAPPPTATPTVTPTYNLCCVETPEPTPGCCGNRRVEGSEECDDGNEVGGDGCAANCTVETLLTLPLRGEIRVEDNFANSNPSASSIAIDTEFVTEQTFRLGGPTTYDAMPLCASGVPFGFGERPVAQRVEDVETIQIQISGIACACIRAVAARRCDAPAIQFASTDCELSVDCTRDASVCGDTASCRFVHGAGNAAAGVIGCVGLDDASYALGRRPACLRLGGRAPNGSALIYSSAVTGVIMGNPMCIEDTSNANNGPDGLPCTDDDPASTRGLLAQATLLTTETADLPLVGPFLAGRTDGASGFDDFSTGSPFDCDDLPGAVRLCSVTRDDSTPGARTRVSTCLEP